MQKNKKEFQVHRGEGPLQLKTKKKNYLDLIRSAVSDKTMLRDKTAFVGLKVRTPLLLQHSITEKHSK